MFETVILHVKLAMLAFGRTLIYVVEVEVVEVEMSDISAFGRVDARYIQGESRNCTFSIYHVVAIVKIK